MADKCRFKDASQPAAENAAKASLRKRRLNLDVNADPDADLGELDSDGFDALGYMPTHVLYGLTAQDEVRLP